jgi:hypothetical protein
MHITIPYKRTDGFSRIHIRENRNKELVMALQQGEEEEAFPPHLREASTFQTHRTLKRKADILSGYRS